MELISREEAIKTVNKWFNLIKQNSDILVDSINSIPTIEERKEGKWINDIIYSGWTCTNCSYHYGNAVDNYCPNCGAHMTYEGE